MKLKNQARKEIKISRKKLEKNIQKKSDIKLLIQT